MAGQVDLDALRAARSEANGEHPTVKFGGDIFELPTEMPFSIVENVNEMQQASEKNDGYTVSQKLTQISHDLFGDRFEEFLGKHPSMLDMQSLLESIAPLYGLQQGESQASEG
jgi:hypothetical protein